MVANTDIGPTYIFLVLTIIRSMTDFGHPLQDPYFTRCFAEVSARDFGLFKYF